MSNVHIFQIFYNEETKNSLDTGFFALDNSINPRPDWREYWPIRNYLKSNILDEDGLYGFFSPKFRSKTGLSADNCFSFINSHLNNVDVFSFSPFYDLGAFFQNSFFQAIAQHPNSLDPIKGALKLINPSLEVGEIIMHSNNNIFCNYFVAKTKFWRMWLENCELIWFECESNNSPLAKQLNALAEGYYSPVPIKNFIIERMASLLLATNKVWNVKAYDPFALPFSTANASHEKSALIQMDALKIAYTNQERPEYLNAFKNIADLIVKKYG